MAETKRVSDHYTISAPTITLDGNLTVMGSTTSVETVNSTVTDNIIILNSGEAGFGITAGSAGIQIDRGGGEEATILFSEASNAFEFRKGGTYIPVRGAYPSDLSDYATKEYVDTEVGTTSAGGSLNAVQFNNGTGFGGSADFLWDGSVLSVKDIRIQTGSINVYTTDSDLQLAANGTGKIYLLSALRIENATVDPSADVDSNVLFTKAVGNAGSGVYFTNNTSADELVSRSKAILFGLIF